MPVPGSDVERSPIVLNPVSWQARQSSPPRQRLGLLALAVILLTTACSTGTAGAAGSTGTPSAGSHGRADRAGGKSDPLIAAAGDIACEPTGKVTPTTCQQKATSDLLVSAPLTAVLTLGDEQYVEGRLKNFQTMYGPTWGRELKITHPAPGNHEYKSGGDGFYEYFGSAAGDPRRPYYSFDIGSWHIIALNSECSFAGGCGAGSPQERWLVADLAAHHNRCTLAFWHEPRFSSGGHGDNTTYDQFWTDLYRAGVDVVLNGHDHDYERFAPQTPTGQADPKHGIREFVVGTGGKNLRPFHRPRPNSQVRSDTFGVLELTLHSSSYDWRFVPIKGSSFTDSGSTSCH
jgi:acid phosphatase type 7